MPQGTIVDWNAPYAQARAGEASVLELRTPDLRGLSWSSSDAKPLIAPLDIGKVDAACPRFADIHQTAVQADATIRSANPGLSPRELGTLIHQDVRDRVKGTYGLGVGVWTEQGLFRGIENNNAFLPKGASRIDVLEDAGKGTVCIYDIKTGDNDMKPKQMIQYWQEALRFNKLATNVYVIPLYTKR